MYKRQAQEIGSQIRFINCKAYQGVGLAEIIRDIRELDYIYAQHKAPHDIKVRELGTGISRLEVGQQLGVNFDVTPQLSVKDGIDAVRAMLNRVVFDRDNCMDGIEALIQYRCEYNDKRNIFSNAPLHDWTSDYADSLRYYAVCPTHTGWGTESDINYSKGDYVT